MDTDASSLKTSVGMVMQAAKGVATKFAGDERIKDVLDACSMEHFEIACYPALAAAAERGGLPEVTEICRRIIRDEERMAKTLKAALPDEILHYLFEVQTASA